MDQQKNEESGCPRKRRDYSPFRPGSEPIIAQGEVNATIRNYETLYIVDSTLTDEQTDAIISKYSTLITEQGGEVQAAGKWDRRRLAYEIKGRREGLYILMYFSGEPAAGKELDRVFRISDEVIRHIILRVEPERVDISRIERPAPSPEQIATERAATAVVPEAAEAPEAVEVSEAPEAAEAAPEAQTQEAPAEETPTEEAPAEEAPGEEAPEEEAPAEETPAEETPKEEAPAEEAPAEETPTEEARTQEAPAQEPEPAVGEAPAEEPAGK
jgi:ribosomal protein S6